MSASSRVDPGEQRPLVIGVGQRFRRDDGVGRAVAVAVRQRASDMIDAIGCDGDACDLVSLWDGRALVVVVDAMRSGATPGTLAEFEIDPLAGDNGEEADAGLSTHAHGVMAAVRLARVLGRLPARLRILAIEVADTGWGDGLTPAVEAAAAAATEQIVDEFRRQAALRMPPSPGAE